MRSFMLGVLLLAGCSDDSPSGTLTLVPDTHQIVVGQYTFVSAYLVDAMGSGSGSNGVAVAASWSASPAGIIMLSPMSNAQKVTALAVGSAVVTATVDGQTQMTGFTVVAP